MNEEMIFELGQASLKFMKKCMQIAAKYGEDEEQTAITTACTHLDMCKDGNAIALVKKMLTKEREEKENE